MNRKRLIFFNFRNFSRDFPYNIVNWIRNVDLKLFFRKNIFNILHNIKSLRSLTSNMYNKKLSPIGWAIKDVPTVNLSSLFFESYNSINKHVSNEYMENVYVGVPGLFTRWYPGYMQNWIQAFKKWGLDAHLCPLNTESSMSQNAQVIYQFIENIYLTKKKKVIIIAHSKGGLDVAASLSFYPNISNYLTAVIAFQVPWGGSIIAQELLSSSHGRSITSTLLEILDGDKHCLEEITYKHRKIWIEKYPYPAETIPTISVTSYENSLRSLMKATQEYIKINYDEDCDGLVATKDAIIPGTSVVYLPGLDHFGPAYQGFPACCKHYNISRVLLSLIYLTKKIPYL